MLGVVAVPDEAVDLSGSVNAAAECSEVVRHAARVRRRIGVGGELRREHVDDEVRHVDVDRQIGIARAVRIESAHEVVVVRIIVSVAFLGRDAPEVLPRRALAFDDAGVVAGLRGAHDVVVRRGALSVALGVVLVHALLGLVQTPVDAVDEEVVVAAAVVALAHVALAVAREDLVYERLPSAVVRPGVVLLGAEVDLLEFTHAFVAEERVLERAHAVLAAEEKAERVLRIARAAAEGAADADAGRHVEFVRGIRRVDLLDLDRTLPFAAVSGRVHVDALRLVEEVLRVDDERDRAHAVREAAAEAQLRVFVLALGDRRAHAVPHRLAVDRLVGRESVRRRRAGGDDLLEEEVRRGRVLLEDRVRVRNRRAHDRRLRDLERTGVAECARAADERRGAVERVVDDRVGMPRAAERELERGVLVSVRLAERHLRREARPTVRRVRRARRGRGGVDELVVARVPLEHRRDEKLGVVDRVVHGDDLERVRPFGDL